MSSKRPQFHGSLMGYSKSEVNEYLSRLEAELEEYENSKSVWNEKITTMELETINLNNVVASKDEEKNRMIDENKRLEDMILILRAKIDSQDVQLKRLRQDYADLQKTYEESDSNPKRIQEAILSAKDFGKQIVDRAHRDADSIRAQVEADKIAKEEEGRKVISVARAQADQLIVDAKVQADQVVSDAQKRHDKLQADYHTILMDASSLKSELMGIYRRHMELLTSIPEPEAIPVEAVDVTSSEEEN